VIYLIKLTLVNSKTKSTQESTARSYRSPIRRRQADLTRTRIAQAARQLFFDKGYAATTIESIAVAAGVAPQTVYAVFRSKEGIVMDLVGRASFGSTYDALVEQALKEKDPAIGLQLAARIACQIHDAQRAEFSLLRSAGIMTPAVAALEEEFASSRFEAQAGLIDLVVRSGQLRSHLKKSDARDILWALTGRELYWMLVVDKGWSSVRYQEWLADLLCAALLEPKMKARHERKAHAKTLDGTKNLTPRRQDAKVT
jgi:AcrR family transcriptional regulator